MSTKRGSRLATHLPRERIPFRLVSPYLPFRLLDEKEEGEKNLSFFGANT